MSATGESSTEHVAGPHSQRSWAERGFSMFASLVVHGTFFVILLAFLSTGGGSGGTGAAGSGGGDFIEVGFSEPSGGGKESQTDKAAPASEFPAQPALPTIDSHPVAVVDQQPPVALPQPNAKARRAVVDAAPPKSAGVAQNLSRPPRSVGNVLPSNGKGGGTGSGIGKGSGDGSGQGGGGGAGKGTGRGNGVGAGNGPGTTQFFNIRDGGLKFVYVVDRSVSMATRNAIREAKRELMKSLESLDAEQQFQVIFYNDKPLIFEIANAGGKGLLRATDINLTLAGHFIEGVQPESSTEHMLALETALALHPDVLFLLTDAGPPELTSADLAKIRKLNGGRTRIHSIEFHQGTKLSRQMTFLEKLALENGGGYQHFDITELDP